MFILMVHLLLYEALIKNNGTIHGKWIWQMSFLHSGNTTKLIL